MCCLFMLEIWCFILPRFDAMKISIQHWVLVATKNLHFDPFLFGGRVSKRCNMFV